MNEKPRRNWKRLLRLVHSYLSLLGLVGLLFFGATGFFLNHPELFGLDKNTTRNEDGALPPEICVGPDKLAIVEALRKDYGARGPLHDFQIDDLEMVVMFRKPGQTTDAIIDRESGELSVEVQESNILAALSQIHRGEDTGTIGGLMIDGIAILLMLIGLTGFALWLTVPTQRKFGLAALAFGVVSITLILGWLFVT